MKDDIIEALKDKVELTKELELPLQMVDYSEVNKIHSRGEIFDEIEEPIKFVILEAFTTENDIKSAFGRVISNIEAQIGR